MWKFWLTVKYRRTNAWGRKALYKRETDIYERGLRVHTWKVARNWDTHRQKVAIYGRGMWQVASSGEASVHTERRYMNEEYARWLVGWGKAYAYKEG